MAVFAVANMLHLRLDSFSLFKSYILVPKSKIAECQCHVAVKSLSSSNYITGCGGMSL